jgi:general L-amino acid transport system substrate-binding protein
LTLHPAAPAYRQGDTQWARIVDWTIYSLIQAEESGITLANVGAQHGSEDPVVQRLIGDDWATAQALELTDHAWAAKVIAVVGNYGEIYDRTVGPNGSLKLPRGLNALWREGGLMHPLPAQ